MVTATASPAEDTYPLVAVRVPALHGGPPEDIPSAYAPLSNDAGAGSAWARKVAKGESNVPELKLGCDNITLDNLDLDGILGNLETYDHHGPQRKRGAGATHLGPPPSDTKASQKLAMQRQAAQGGSQRASARHSLLHGPALVGGCCGERLQFSMTAVTEDGKICDSSNTRVAAHVTGLSLLSKAFPEPRPWVEDRKDGTYIVQFVCATPGQYHVSAYIDGILLPMCPVTINVTPGPASPMHCDVTGEGSRAVRVGGYADFTIQARDEFGNPCITGGHRFSIRAVGHARLHEVVDNEDGTYVATYSVPEWGQAPIQLDVFLNGIPIKDSPVTPKLQGLQKPEPKPLPFGPGGDAFDPASMAAQLRWLQQNAPSAIPDMPEIPVGAFGSGGVIDAGSLSSGLGGSEAASRLAWRAADEWKRLSELREEMTRARESLLEYQAALVSVGGQVHKQFSVIKDDRRLVQDEKAELGDVHARLDWLRGDLARVGRGDRSPSPGSDRAISDGKPESTIVIGPGVGRLDNDARGSPPQTSPSPNRTGGFDLDGQMSSVQAKLDQLNEGIAQKRRWLEDTEAQAGPNFGSRQQPSPSTGQQQSYNTIPESPVTPLYAQPPPDAYPMPATQSRSRKFIEEMPPPVPPPALHKSGATFRDEPVDDRSWQSSRMGQTGETTMRTPPQSAKPDSGYYETSGGLSSPGRGASPEELGQAMRRLFSQFATRTASAGGGARGGKSTRKSLGLQDYIRLASAAQLRLPNDDLEDAFRQTVQRYGGSTAPDGEKTLAFEIFVELLVETARKRYGDLSDPESTAALFEEHLLPLARHLNAIEGRADD